MLDATPEACPTAARSGPRPDADPPATPGRPTTPGRRGVLLGTAAALGAGSALTACGSGSSTSSSSSAASSAAPADSASPAASGAASAAASAGTPALAKLSDIPVGGARLAAGPDGAPIVIAQPERGTVVAYSAACTHQGCKVTPQGRTLMCPCHGSTFDAFTGKNLSGPAPSPLPAVSVTVQGGDVVAR